MSAGRSVIALAGLIARLTGGQESPLETGRRQFGAGDLAAAELTLTPLGPTNGSAALLLSRIAHSLGRADDAVKWGEQAARLLPDSARAHVWLGRAYLLKLEHVSFLKKGGMAKRARAEYDRALALDSNDVEVREARARYFMNAPSIAGGNKDSARREAEAARRIDPYGGALLRGQIEERDKKPSVAEAEYAALIRGYPDSATPFNRLVNLFQTAQKYSEAFHLIDERSARLSSDESTLYQLGKTAALAGERLAQGEVALHEYMALGKFSQSSEAWACYRLGMILEKRGDTAGAIREYETAEQLDPKLEEATEARKRLR
ncbi:MAG TPA: tetratricopeptide repeat protein [Gemmatimonadales bacterium]|nr:tetratricopeptide repeat protein [Gemmatimonadales bacterium]